MERVSTSHYGEMKVRTASEWWTSHHRGFFWLPLSGEDPIIGHHRWLYLQNLKNETVFI